MSDVNCYIDFEFTTTSNKNKDLKNNAIELLSVGCVFEENGEIIDRFYEIVKPAKNTILTKYCKDLVKISQKEVDDARSFGEVIKDLEIKIKKHKCKEIYNWGSFDKVALRRSFRINRYKGEFVSMAYRLCDLQPKISKNIRYNGKVIAENWGLQKVKKVYGLEPGESVHNALSDAIDLYQIHQSFKRRKNINNQVVIDEYNKRLNYRKFVEQRRIIKYRNDIADIEKLINGLDLGVLVNIEPGQLRGIIHTYLDECNINVGVGVNYICLGKKKVFLLRIDGESGKGIVRSIPQESNTYTIDERIDYNQLNIMPNIVVNESDLDDQIYFKIALSTGKRDLATVLIPLNKQTKSKIREFLIDYKYKKIS